MAPVPTVHIIEDDEAVRDSLTILLETHGFAVNAYGSARAFLDRSPDGARNCVVTDVEMPEMNGLQLLSAFQERGLNLPVLVVTARSGRALAEEAMALGALAVIEKPFAPDSLVETVRATLAATRRD